MFLVVVDHDAVGNLTVTLVLSTKHIHFALYMQVAMPFNVNKILSEISWLKITVCYKFSCFCCIYKVFFSYRNVRV